MLGNKPSSSERTVIFLTIESLFQPPKQLCKLTLQALTCHLDVFNRFMKFQRRMVFFKVYIFRIYVCVWCMHACMCVHIFLLTCLGMTKAVLNGRCLLYMFSILFLKRGYFWTWRSLISLDCLSSKCLWSFCWHFSRIGFLGVSFLTQLFTWVQVDLNCALHTWSIIFL